MVSASEFPSTPKYCTVFAHSTECKRITHSRSQSSLHSSNPFKLPCFPHTIRRTGVNFRSNSSSSRNRFRQSSCIRYEWCGSCGRNCRGWYSTSQFSVELKASFSDFHGICHWVGGNESVPALCDYFMSDTTYLSLQYKLPKHPKRTPLRVVNETATISSNSDGANATR